jgi:LacI family transcriptional regulator
MACNDVRGQQILDACNRVELAVPEEVAVIGVDNDELLCELCNPPLSSVIPNPECIGYKAAELLDRLMAGKKPEPDPLRIAPLGIATRQSTDVLAIDDPEVAVAVKFIREHACEGARVNSILAHVPLSRSILERRFRKYLGHSPQQMLRGTQLERVKQLLIKTDLPLSKIAELAGFKHTEYMCVAFKRQVGRSPGAFRRLSQV